MYVLYSNHYILELLVLFAKSFAIPKKFSEQLTGQLAGVKGRRDWDGFKELRIDWNWIELTCCEFGTLLPLDVYLLIAKGLPKDTIYLLAWHWQNYFRFYVAYPCRILSYPVPIVFHPVPFVLVFANSCWHCNLFWQSAKLIKQIACAQRD